MGCGLVIGENVRGGPTHDGSSHTSCGGKKDVHISMTLLVAMCRSVQTTVEQACMSYFLREVRQAVLCSKCTQSKKSDNVKFKIRELSQNGKLR